MYVNTVCVVLQYSVLVYPIECGLPNQFTNCMLSVIKLMFTWRVVLIHTREGTFGVLKPYNSQVCSSKATVAKGQRYHSALSMFETLTLSGCQIVTRQY